MRAQRNKGISSVGKLFLALAVGISLVYLPVAAQEDTAPAPAAPKLKSEVLAFSLSLFGTLIPGAIGFAGVPFAFLGCLIGPSLGYFYTGLWGRALLGIGIRTLAAGVCVAGAATVVGWAFVRMFGGSRASDGAANLGGLMAVGGLVLCAGSALVDIFSVDNAVRDHNIRLQEKKLSLSPFYLPSSKTVGIQVQFSF